MSVKNLSNASDSELVQDALTAFEKNKTLVIYANRGRSFAYVQKLPNYEDSPFMVDSNLREYCLANVTAKVDETADYFFRNMRGDTCYVDQSIVDQFTSLAREKFPDLKFTRNLAVVDAETDVELMPADTAKQYATTSDISIAIKVSSWAAKLIP